MLLDTVDASYWFLMPVLSCICLTVAIILAVSSSGGQRCCRRKQYEDDVRWVADGQKCGGGGGNDDDPTNAAAVEEDLNVDDDDFLADIVTKMRSFSECHIRPYVYEPSHGEKSAVIVVPSSERDRNVVNTLTEQMQHSKFAVVSSTGELKGSATTHAMHCDHASVPAEDQIQQQDLGTSPRGTYENCSGRAEDCRCSRAMSGIYDEANGCCMHASNGSVRTYTALNASSSTDFPSGTATVASYACLINQKTDSSYLNVCTSDSMLGNGDQNVGLYNVSLPDSNNSYTYTLPGVSTMKSDTTQPRAADDSIATGHSSNAIWRSCDRPRSEVESGHYSTLDKYDCNGATTSGIYDSIEDPKYLTVCTTSPAATKQEHELKAKEKAEMEAAKRKTMTLAAAIGETQLRKTTTNEVY